MVGRVLAKDEVGVRFSLSAPNERSEVGADREYKQAALWFGFLQHKFKKTARLWVTVLLKNKGILDFPVDNSGERCIKGRLLSPKRQSLTKTSFLGINVTYETH